jgi:predicted RNA-binding protein with PIN domain
MRWIIDGYNVMHAGGLIGPKISREGFRRARRRFLDRLARAFGPEDAILVTVVFDATQPPGDMPVRGRYQGLSVIFSVGDENADARIEELISAHSHPKDLTVVSTDRRIRQAATRRRSRSLTADSFWDRIDRRIDAASSNGATAVEAVEPEGSGEAAVDELTFWLKEFGDLDALPEIREVARPLETLITDAEIRAIEREVASEVAASRRRR